LTPLSSIIPLFFNYSGFLKKATTLNKFSRQSKVKQSSKLPSPQQANRILSKFTSTGTDFSNSLQPTERVTGCSEKNNKPMIKKTKSRHLLQQMS